MVQSRYTSLFLVLLLSLVVGLLAHREVGVTINNYGLAIETTKEVSHETKKIADSTQTRSLIRGRKIGVVDVQKEEGRSEANAGKDMKSSNKSYGTSNTKGALEPVNHSKPLQGKSERSEVSAAPGVLELQDPNGQPTQTHELLEATAEIFKMLNKDYNQKARRRPPINNHLPFGDHKAVTP